MSKHDAANTDRCSTSKGVDIGKHDVRRDAAVSENPVPGKPKPSDDATLWEARRVMQASQPDSTTPDDLDSPRWDWGPVGPPHVGDEEQEEHQLSAELHIPGPEETVGFDAHIKALFRDKDRRSMAFAFDLGSYDDVRSHADAIVTRLRAGTMPCDEAWSQDKVDLFQRWIDGGGQE